MTNLKHAELPDFGQTLESSTEEDTPSILLELAKVLAARPGGLRRWSVMHAIRAERERAGRDVPLKMEDEVERAFRRYCAGEKNSDCPDEEALFYRPREKAGEVWAAYPERVKALLANNDNEA